MSLNRIKLSAGGFRPLGLFRTPKRTVYEGKFETDGAAAAVNCVGFGWSVARTAQGVFRVTFSRSFKTAVRASCQLQGATGHNDVATPIAFSAGDFDDYAYLDIETQSAAGTNADLNGPVVHFHVVFSDTASDTIVSTSV